MKVGMGLGKNSSNEKVKRMKEGLQCLNVKQLTHVFIFRNFTQFVWTLPIA